MPCFAFYWEKQVKKQNKWCPACMCAVLSRFSHARLFAIPWMAVLQAPLFMGFSRQEYWSGLLCPLLGDLPDSGMDPMSLESSALEVRFFTTSTTWEAPIVQYNNKINILLYITMINIMKTHKAMFKERNGQVFCFRKSNDSKGLWMTNCLGLFNSKMASVPLVQLVSRSNKL